MTSNQDVVIDQDLPLSDGKWTEVTQKSKKFLSDPKAPPKTDETANVAETDKLTKRSSTSVHSASSAISLDLQKKKQKAPGKANSAQLSSFFKPSTPIHEQGKNYTPGPATTVKDLVRQVKATRKKTQSPNSNPTPTATTHNSKTTNNEKTTSKATTTKAAVGTFQFISASNQDQPTTSVPQSILTPNARPAPATRRFIINDATLQTELPVFRNKAVMATATNDEVTTDVPGTTQEATRHGEHIPFSGKITTPTYQQPSRQLLASQSTLRALTESNNSKQFTKVIPYSDVMDDTLTDGSTQSLPPHISEPIPYSPSRQNDGQSEERMDEEAMMKDMETDIPPIQATIMTQIAPPPVDNRHARATTENPEDNSDSTTKNNNLTAEDSDAMSSDEEQDTEGEQDLLCPNPHRPYFWRIDLVTFIPVNTNPILTVASKAAEALTVLQSVDKRVLLYPYRAAAKKKAIDNPGHLVTLNQDLYDYVDKGSFFRYSSKEVKSCRFSIAIGAVMDIHKLCESAQELLLPFQSQVYPRSLNYPSIGRVGFFLYSHQKQLSDTLIKQLQQAVKFKISLQWRRAIVKWDLYAADAKSEDGKSSDIPHAILIECQEQEIKTCRRALQLLYPLRHRHDRFTYPCGIRLTFGHSYNGHEIDQVPEDSSNNIRSMWHIQKLANRRLRATSLSSIIRKPSQFESPVQMADGTTLGSLKSAILSLRVPYTDSRDLHPPVFDSVESILPRKGGGSIPEIWVVFRPQHAKYAGNVTDYLLLHLVHQLQTPDAYVTKLFKREHVRFSRDKNWHDEHKKVFEKGLMQVAYSQTELLHTMADFNFDMTVVHEDAAFLATPADAADNVSAPVADGRDSQNLSIFQSLGTVRTADEELEDSTQYYQPPRPVEAGLSYAQITQVTPTQTRMPTLPTKDTAPLPATTPPPPTATRPPRIRVARGATRAADNRLRQRSSSGTKKRKSNLASPAIPPTPCLEDVSIITTTTPASSIILAEDSSHATSSISELEIRLRAEYEQLLEAQYRAQAEETARLLDEQEAAFKKRLPSNQSNTARRHGGGNGK